MSELTLMKGNEALAEAAIRAGCKCFFGYPITPQTEVAAYLSKRMPKVGGVFLQAESEIAAINMIYGCAGSGVRCMTSSSSPGISLKTEGISYIAGADLPCVIIDVQRGGPGLGGIQPSQADYWQVTRALGHGDLRTIVFAPASVQEMADTVTKAFDLADQYRMPAVILADGLLGQMMEPVSFDENVEIKMADASDKPWAATGHGNKREHNIISSLELQANKLEDKIRQRFLRYEEVKAKHTMAASNYTEDAQRRVLQNRQLTRRVKKASKQAFSAPLPCGLTPKRSLTRLAKTQKRFLRWKCLWDKWWTTLSWRLIADCPLNFWAGQAA